ncbi:restriction endonuclease subunit S [Fundicoccus sp. Sow4_H7]|uniref:restriction endonuclease subunit S n=1 Tax=Fundicoccus sp. Sow4_H7 TaxID=3438784 RepID=UPI003F933F0F
MTNTIIKKEKDWNYFEFKDIFDLIQRGKRLTKSNQIPGKIPYVSSSAQKNGVDGFIGNDFGVRKFSNCLTIANSGSVGATFFHPYEFIASDHVTVLKSSKMNNYIYIFISNLLSRLNEKYHFNREINDFRIKREKIMLPIDHHGAPDWLFMETKGKIIFENKFQSILKYIEPKIKELEHDLKGSSDMTLVGVEWNSYEINTFFIFNRVKGLSETNYVKGDHPFVSTSSINNGISAFVKADVKHLTKGNSLTINPITGKAFYHGHDFVGRGGAGSSIYELHEQNLTKYSGLFISMMLSNSAESKASFGVQLNGERLKKTKFLLPSKNGKPDWEFMEQYMKLIELKKLKQLYSYIISKIKNN